jgi:hypothetical protein
MVKRIALAFALAVPAAPLVALAQTATPIDSETTPQPSAMAPAPPASAPRPLPDEPALHHVPATVAARREKLAIGARIDRPDLVKRAVVVYRHGEAVDEALFERSAVAGMPYVAVIPAEAVDGPAIAYAIELERPDGKRVAVFASRESMQPVQVVSDSIDAEEDALLRRLGGRRFVVDASGEYVSFGTATASNACATSPCPAGGAGTATSTQIAPDYYWRSDVGVTYRMLRVVSEFGIRGGVYRGSGFAPDRNYPSYVSVSDVGLNYGAPWIRLRATDWLHFEGEFLTSITEIGFSMGGGGAVLIGDEYASHLTLGVEGVDVFGVRGYSRFDVVASRWLRLAPMIEVTNMRHAPTAGVRLLGEAGIGLGYGWMLTLRGGYQARTFNSGGPSAGGGLAYAF